MMMAASKVKQVVKANFAPRCAPINTDGLLPRAGLLRNMRTLYATGNTRLLKTRKVAILNSANASDYSVTLAARVAELSHELGFTVVTSNTKVYLAVLEQCSARNIPCIVVYDRPLPEKLPGGTNAQSCLCLSPYSDRFPPKQSNRIRDSIVAGLADEIIAIEIRSGGMMEQVLAECLKIRKPVLIADFPATGESATRRLTERGAVSYTPDLTLAELRHHLTRSGHPGFQPDSDLGQFFTPETVVEFMYKMVSTYLGTAIPKDWKIFDPACGEGVFLKYAFESRIAPAENLFGVDIDPNLAHLWTSGGLRKGAHLLVSDGLIDQPQIGISQESFDLVIGNPPFGGTGFRNLLRLLPQPAATSDARRGAALFSNDEEVEIQESAVTAVAEESTPFENSTPVTPTGKRYYLRLLQSLDSLDCLRKAPVDLPDDNGGNRHSLFGDGSPSNTLRTKNDRIQTEALQKLLRGLDAGASQIENAILSSKPLQDWIRKVATFPIEVAFVERFVRLAKPGGMIALIVPNGITSNAQLKFLRDWLSEHARLIAVVSLPRETFKKFGINASTSILFLQRLKPAEKVNPEGYIMLVKTDFVGVNSGGKNDLPAVVDEFKHFCKTGEILHPHFSPMMVRVDPEDMTRLDRWDPDFYRPEYVQLDQLLKRKGAVQLSDFIGELVSGYRASSIRFNSRGAVAAVKVGNIRFSGLDLSRVSLIPDTSPAAAGQFLIQEGDLLICRKGEGGPARGKLTYVFKDPGPASAFGDIYRLAPKTRRHGPFLATFLLSKYGKNQIIRLQAGVASPTLDKMDLEKILVVKPSKHMLDLTESGWGKVYSWHERAIHRKIALRRARARTGDIESDPEFSRSIQKAEAELKEMMQELESLIG